MPLYQYQGFDNTSRSRKGMVDAGSIKEAKQKLRLQGILVSSLSEKTDHSRRSALRGENLVTVTLQLSQLINAGLPLYESLLTLEEQYRSEKFHPTLLSLTELVRGGSSLSGAMRQHPDSFDRLYCAMVEAGEAAGALDQVLTRLAAYLTRQQKLRENVNTALIYPGVLASAAIILVVAMLTFVIPMMNQLLEGRDVNWVTGMVLTASYIFRNYWYVFLLVLGCLGTGLYFWLRTPQGRQLSQRALMRTPVISSLLLNSALSRFAETMATLLTGGLPLVEALRLGRETVTIDSIRSSLESAELQVIEGKSLSDELKKIEQLPPMVHRLVAVGEETGRLAAMWSNLADMYDSELEKSLGRIMALAPPVIIVFMGIVVGTILLGVVLPLTNISNFM